MANEAYTRFQMLLREEAAAAVEDLTPEQPDDILWYIMSRAKPVRVGKTIVYGSNAPYEYSWNVRVQRAGRISGGSFAGSTQTLMGPDSLLPMGQAADAKYLDPAYTPNRGYLTMTQGLKRMRGQLTANMSDLQADFLSNPVESVAADHVEDVVYLARKLMTVLGYSDGYGVIGIVTGGGTTYTVSEGTTGTAVSVSASQIYRFEKGQRYVAASLSSGVPTTPVAGSLNTPGVFRCVDINPRNNTVTFESEPGEGNITLTDDDGIILEGMYDFGTSTSASINTIKQLLLDSDAVYFPGSTYYVNKHSELMSYVYAADDSDVDWVFPEPHVFASILDTMADAGDKPPSVLVGQRAIWTLFSQIQQDRNMIVSVPQGAVFQANGGVTLPVIQHGTHRFALAPSSYIEPNAVFGLTPGSFQRSLPDGMDRIRWAMSDSGVSGFNGIFRPVTSGRQLTETLAADFDLFGQIGQTRPRNNFRRHKVYNSQTAVSS